MKGISFPFNCALIVISQEILYANSYATMNIKYFTAIKIPFLKINKTAYQP